MILTLEEELYALMKECALEGGKVLLALRGNVPDLGKSVKDALHDEYAAHSAAKTIADDIVQELFLARLYRSNPSARINVEEDTPLRDLFAGNKRGPITAHQDPLDGTRSYLDGHDEFATGMAISDNKNQFTHTAIFAPARGELYAANPNGCAVFDTQMRAITPDQGPCPRSIIEKRLLNERGKNLVRELGFTLTPFRSAHTGVVDVGIGRAAAFLYGYSNPHDSLIPYAFAMRSGATLLDAEGNPISGKDVKVTIHEGFPVFGRLASVCYFSSKQACFTSSPSEGAFSILRVLADDRNLHPEYLKIRKR